MISPRWTHGSRVYLHVGANLQVNTCESKLLLTKIPADVSHEAEQVNTHESGSRCSVSRLVDSLIWSGELSSKTRYQLQSSSLHRGQYSEIRNTC
jgi:hypothetical protein